MKIYSSFRLPSGEAVVIVEQIGTELQGDLPLRLDLRDHSPTGFNWGYGGSGPAQLALALLADATGEDEWALARYHAFKSDWLGGRGSTWLITQEDILDWLKKRPLTQDELVTYTMELEDRRR